MKESEKEYNKYIYMLSFKYSKNPAKSIGQIRRENPNISLGYLDKLSKKYEGIGIRDVLMERGILSEIEEINTDYDMLDNDLFI